MKEIIQTIKARMMPIVAKHGGTNEGAKIISEVMEILNEYDKED